MKTGVTDAVTPVFLLNHVLEIKYRKLGASVELVLSI
jgi:hypothetical protein